MTLPEKLRNGGRTYTDPCGCEWQGQRWLKLCPLHAAEELEIHQRAMADYHEAVVSSNNEARASAVRPEGADPVAGGLSEHA